MHPKRSPENGGNSPTVQGMALDPDTARRLRRAAAKAADGTVERDRLIVEAYKAGAGLREIARAVNMTHPGVRRIVHKHTGQRTEA